MTMCGKSGEGTEEHLIIVLSDTPARAQFIEQTVSGVPFLHQHRVITVPVKKKFEPHTACPRMIILDDENGNMDPLQWVKQVHSICPETSLILIGPNKDPLLASRALRAGASAFIEGKECESILPEALSRIAERKRYVSEEVMQGILHGMTQNNSEKTSLPVESLSDREMMVFQLLGEGKSVQDIADELGVNIKTVSTHCNNVRRKLHADDNQQLVTISRDWVAKRCHQ